MVSCYCNQYRNVLGGLTAIAVTLTVPLTMTASAQRVKNVLDPLPVQERVALRDGEATVAGDDGEFIGRVLVNAPVATAWEVLTDYNNFEAFFPNVENSELLESAGDRNVFEQVNVARIFLFKSRSRVVIAATESYPQQISFQLVEGDMDSLQGVWRLEPVAPYKGAQPNQVLITHQVALEPDEGGITRSLFFSTYRNILEDTMLAIKQETERRAEPNAEE